MTYTPPKDSDHKPFAVIGRRVPFPGVLTTVVEVPVEVQVPIETPIIIHTPIPLRIETAEPVEVMAAEPREEVMFEPEEPEFELEEPEVAPLETPEVDQPIINLSLGNMDFAPQPQDLSSLGLEPLEVRINGHKPRRPEPDAGIKSTREVRIT